MADIKSETAFGRAAVAFDVHESDYYVLLGSRINTLETLAFRFPEASDFESFLRKVMRVTAAYLDENGQVQTYSRPKVFQWEDYRQEDDAGCLRQLWTLASKASHKAMERLAGDDPETKAKVTLTRSQELEDRAIDEGMPAPTSDKERPSLHTLTKVQGTFGPGGSYQHLSWESYLSMEVENQLRRAGKFPKDKKEVYVQGEKLGLSSKDEGEITNAVKITDVLTLQDAFELRARAFQMLDVCPYKVVMEYSSKVVSLLRSTVAEGMRPPTLNEARKTDREIMGEILKWVGKGKASVEKGLVHYATSGDADLWKLMSPQIEGHPDQGLDKKPPEPEHPPKTDRGNKRKIPEEPSAPATERDSFQENPRLCLVCRKRHEPRCAITAEWQQQQKQKRQAKGKGKSSGSKDEGPKRPKSRDSSSQAGLQPAGREGQTRTQLLPRSEKKGRLCATHGIFCGVWTFSKTAVLCNPNWMFHFSGTGRQIVLLFREPGRDPYPEYDFPRNHLEMIYFLKGFLM